MKFGVVVEGTVFAVEGADVSGFLDAVMGELVKLESEDPGINATLATGELQISVVVEANNPVDASLIGSSLIRTAVHAAGGETPDWPTRPEHWGITLLAIESRQADLVDA